MKKLLLSVVSMNLMAGSAFAADLPTRKEAVIVPAATPIWTGFYAGLNMGYNFGTNGNAAVGAYNPPWIFPAGTPNNGTIAPNTLNSSNVAALSYSGIAGINQNGVIGGAQVGYNYQYGNKIVIGLEADFQGTGSNGTSRINGASYGLQPYQGAQNVPPNPIAGAVTNATGYSDVQSGLNWIGTVRGRVGYLFTPTLLIYGTGGLAYGNAYASVNQFSVENIEHQRNMANTSAIINPAVPSVQNVWFGGGNQTQTLVGWSAGAGGEWMLTDNWSLKAEALYWNLGSMNVNTSALGSGINTPPGGPAAGVTWAFLNSTNLGWGRTSVQYSGVIARAGVNYHFNLGTAPVVAKY